MFAYSCFSRFLTILVLVGPAFRNHPQAMLYCARYRPPHRIHPTQSELIGRPRKSRRLGIRSCIPLKEPRAKLTRSASIPRFMQTADPSKIKTDALKAKEEDEIEDPSHLNLLIDEEHAEKSQSRLHEKHSNPESAVPARTFKVLRPVAPPPKPDIGVVRKCLEAIKRFFAKTMSNCIGFFNRISELMPCKKGQSFFSSRFSH